MRSSGQSREGAYADGPRTNVLRRLALFAALLLPACIDAEAVDYAFCDADETCEPVAEPLECSDGVCGEDVLVDSCAAAFICQEHGVGKCIATAFVPGEDDKNKCTHDVCEDGAWRHVPFTTEEIDDGDPCTEDGCDPTNGPYHTKLCG